jgi:predicted nucleic acid-binding protein
LKLLLDTNVILDVLLDRKPFVADSARVVAAVETGRIEGSLCATTITTIHYLASQTLGGRAAIQEVSSLLHIFRVAPVTEAVLKAALHGTGRDYEDLVLLESARGIGADGIVTRNPGDFPRSGVPVYLPADIVAMCNL